MLERQVKEKEGLEVTGLRKLTELTPVMEVTELTEVTQVTEVPEVTEIWINQGKKTNLKPLKINSYYSWCVDLKRLVIQESVFKRYFKIENNDFDFRDAITESEREVLRKKAYENYILQKNF